MAMFIEFEKKKTIQKLHASMPNNSGSFQSHSIAIYVTCRWNFYAFALLIDRTRVIDHALILFPIAASNVADLF